MIWMIIAIIELVIIVGAIALNYKSLQRFSNVKKNADMISNGNLNLDDIKLDGRSQNSMDDIARALNSIKNNLLTFIRASKTNVVTLSNAVSELSESVENNREGNDQIANEAGNVACKTSEQFEIVKDNLTIIEDNHSYMQEIENSINYIERLVHESNTITKDGMNSIDGYQRDMEAMSNELSRINGILTGFNNEIAKIATIGDFIINVNEELILLALNASIEAARAGQAGRGFAVVADQMNALSVQTRESMDSINEILKEVVDSSSQVNESIAECENTYNRSKDTFEQVSYSFETINRQSFEIKQRMQDITAKFTTLFDNTNISQEKAQNLYETSEAISASTNDIAGATQEVSAESIKIGESAQALESMLQSLQRLLVQFNTAVVPVAKDREETVKILAISMLDNPFWYGVRNGVHYAITELAGRNVQVDYVPIVQISELAETLRMVVRKAIDEKYDGITFPGFMGDANDLFQEAVKKGIIIMPYNCDCNPSIKCHAVCKPDVVELGSVAATMCGNYLPSGGKVVILNGNPEVNTNRVKYEAFMEQIKKQKNITILDNIMCDDFAESVHEKAIEAIKKYPDVDIIYLVLGYPLAAAKAIEDCRMTGKVLLVGYDHSQEIFQYIKKGVIAGAIGQDDFAQGHDPIIWLYNHIVDGVPFPDNGFVRCKSTIADRSNINTLLEG